MQPTEAQLLERRIWRHFSKGLTQYHLLDDGDHILLGLSGGKDSLALLDFMSRRARIHRPKLTLTALHVRMANIDYESDTAYLEDFAAARGVRLIVRETSFDPSTDTRKSPCFLCSWNRRKMLFTVARNWVATRLRWATIRTTSCTRCCSTFLSKASSARCPPGCKCASSP